MSTLRPAVQLVFLVLPALAQVATAQSLFEERPVDYPALPVLGPYVATMGVADIDHDGDDDLLTVVNDDVTIFRQQSGAWVPQLAAGAGYGQFAVADLDADGFTDLVIGAKIWWGNGVHVFPAGTTTMFNNGGYTARTETSDVDHDGDLDLVLTDPSPVGPHGATLLRNQGNRTFVLAPPLTTFPSGNSGTCLAYCVDIDGDTFDDIIQVSRDARTRLYWNNGGTFTEATVAQFPLIQSSLSGVAVADLDGDGDRDMVLGGWNGTGILLTTTGPRQLAIVPTTSIPRHVITLDVADGDGDGDLDLTVFRRDQGCQLVNDGTGQFVQAALFGSCDEARIVVRADLDDDGDVDFLRVGSITSPTYRTRVAASYTVRPGLFLHLGDSRIPLADSIAGMQIGDINGDGLHDISMMISPTFPLPPAPLEFAANDGRGVFTYRHADRSGISYAGFFADLNADGRDEWVFTAPSASYLPNIGGELATVPIPLPVVGQVLSGVGANIDGDGNNELFFVLEQSGFASFRVLVDVAGTWQDETVARIPLPPIDYSLSSSARVVPVDVDDDGDVDLWCHTDREEHILRNDGDGVFVAIPNAILPSAIGGWTSSTSDVDGDGDIDLHAGRHILLNDGSGMFTDASANVPAIYGNDNLRHLADLDDDGDPDLIGQGLTMWNDGQAHFTVAPGVLPWTTFDPIGVYACTDIDRDSDLDVLAVQDNKTRVYVNMLRQFWLTGTSAIGGTLDFQFATRPGQEPAPTAILLVCSFAKIEPLDLGEFGWLMLDPTQMMTFAVTVLPAAGGEATYSVPIPPGPMRLGRFVCAQSVEVRAGRLRLGNLVETILGQ